MSQGIQRLANIFFIKFFFTPIIKNNRLITGGHMPSSRLSMRFAAGSWCLIAFVLVYAYNSTLVSYISLSKYESIVNTWDDLAASTSLRVTAPRGSISAEIILVRTDFFFMFFILNSFGILCFCHFFLKEFKDGSVENAGRQSEAQSRRSFVDLTWRTGQSLAFRMLRLRRSRLNLEQQETI